MFFSTYCEPNCGGADYMGSFSPDGDKELQWALDNQKALE
jgi:hypothetical protein